MGKKKEYFLIARNKNSNEYQIIKINNKRRLSLEEIDEFTLNFDNGIRMNDYLMKAKVLDSSGYDFYIANQTNNKMQYLEVVYCSRETRTELLQNVIRASKKKELTKDNESAKSILDSFSIKVFEDRMFNQYIINGKSKLPKKFVDYFVGNQSVNYNAKYRNGAWPITSYSLLRNIIVEMNRYDSNDKLFIYSDKSSRDNELKRRQLDSKLLLETADDYIEGQMDLFSLLDEKSDEDKLIEVLHTFSYLPSETITKNKNGEYCYRVKTFPEYENGDLRKLQTLLTKELAKAIYEMLKVRQTSSIFDDGHYTEELKEARIKITNQLSENRRLLDNAYNWCLVYNKYSERYLGDNYGRQYTKQESN